MATKVNLLIEQGSDFSTSYTLRDENGLVVDLSTFTGRSQMRKHHSSNTAHSFTVNTFANGLVTLVMTAAVTANIEDGRWVYDIELVSGSNVVSRPIEGQVVVKPEVTRS
jgi:predicted molibdopterin-dependent oxidoreductase YjgC